MVSGSINHGHCAIHRPCNSNGLYDPDACESCIKHWPNTISNPGLAHASVKVIKNLVRQMRGSTAFNKRVNFKNVFFYNNNWKFFKFKSSHPNEVVSVSESVLSEVISTEKSRPTTKPSGNSNPPKHDFPRNLSSLLSNPAFEEDLQWRFPHIFLPYLLNLIFPR